MKLISWYFVFCNVTVRTVNILDIYIAFCTLMFFLYYFYFDIVFIKYTRMVNELLDDSKFQYDPLLSLFSSIFIILKHFCVVIR